MGELSWNALKQIVYERAHGCCEYCQTCEANSGQTMQVDHIDPNGDDVMENLCLSCWNCNSSKHKATLVIDPETEARVPLFNPRTQVWSEHFEWATIEPEYCCRTCGAVQRTTRCCSIVV